METTDVGALDEHNYLQFVKVISPGLSALTRPEKFPISCLFIDVESVYVLNEEFRFKGSVLNNMTSANDLFSSCKSFRIFMLINVFVVYAIRRSRV